MTQTISFRHWVTPLLPKDKKERSKLAMLLYGPKAAQPEEDDPESDRKPYAFLPFILNLSEEDTRPCSVVHVELVRWLTVLFEMNDRESTPEMRWTSSFKRTKEMLEFAMLATHSYPFTHYECDFRGGSCSVTLISKLPIPKN